MRPLAGEVQLTFGATGVFIQEVGEIPNLGMHSDPAILSRAVLLQFRAGYLQFVCGVHIVVEWVSACLTCSWWENVSEKAGQVEMTQSQLPGFVSNLPLLAALRELVRSSQGRTNRVRAG